MKYVLYSLRLPMTVYVDMFFDNLPNYDVILRDEDMVFTGYCEDCKKQYHSKDIYDENCEIELNILYCPICTNELFCLSYY